MATTISFRLGTLSATQPLHTSPISLRPVYCRGSHRPSPSDLRSAAVATKGSESSSLKKPPRPPVPFIAAGGALAEESNAICFIAMLGAHGEMQVGVEALQQQCFASAVMSFRTEGGVSFSFAYLLTQKSLLLKGSPAAIRSNRPWIYPQQILTCSKYKTKQE